MYTRIYTLFTHVYAYNGAIYITNILNGNSLRKLFASELCTSLRHRLRRSPAPPKRKKKRVVHPCRRDTHRPFRALGLNAGHTPGVCTQAVPAIKGARGKRWHLFLLIFGHKLLHIITICSTWNNSLNLFFFSRIKGGIKSTFVQMGCLHL